MKLYNLNIVHFNVYALEKQYTHGIKMAWM